MSASGSPRRSCRPGAASPRRSARCCRRRLCARARAVPRRLGRALARHGHSVDLPVAGRPQGLRRTWPDGQRLRLRPGRRHRPAHPPGRGQVLRPGRRGRAPARHSRTSTTPRTARTRSRPSPRSRRRTARSGPRPPGRSPTTLTHCWRSTTSRPSTGFTCARRIRRTPRDPRGMADLNHLHGIDNYLREGPRLPECGVGSLTCSYRSAMTSR